MPTKYGQEKQSKGERLAAAGRASTARSRAQRQEGNARSFGTSGEGRADLVGEGRGVVPEGPRWPANAEAALRVGLRDDVEMHVEDCLVGERFVVLENIVGAGSGGLFHCPADTRQDPPEGRPGIIAELVEGRRRFFGDDEGVPSAHGADVQEGEHVLIFVNLVARDLPADDFRENGLCHDELSG